jgi:hypothetical protein
VLAERPFAAAVAACPRRWMRKQEVIPAWCISGAQRACYLVSGTWTAELTIGTRRNARREGPPAAIVGGALGPLANDRPKLRHTEYVEEP